LQLPIRLNAAPGCAPSLLDEPFAIVPALRQAIDKGWDIVGTDFVGLGDLAYEYEAHVSQDGTDTVRSPRAVFRRRDPPERRQLHVQRPFSLKRPTPCGHTR
jgi:hypothetical protein